LKYATAMRNRFDLMFQCDYWAMTRLGNAICNLQEVPDRALVLYAHLLATQQVWQCRILGIPYTMNAWPQIPREEWLAFRHQNQEQLTAFLQNLNEADYSKVVSYTTSSGVSYSSSTEDILTHMITHSNYHMGQINLLLKPVLQVLPDLSYITFRRSTVNS
jgi:uncharacterized damage-inducible protein DinB